MVYNFQQGVMAGASAAGGYTIDQSIRFNDDDSPTLQRTFGSAGGNTWTFSCWMKRGNLGKNLGIFYALPSVNSGLGINPSDQIKVSDDGAAEYNTTAVFRDPSAWYHIVFTGNGTLNKVYVNNVLQTLSGSPNIGSGINKAVNHKIGESASTSSGGPYMDGYLAEIVFVDGTELSPTDFGETNAVGVWIPKDVSGLTFGSNGFYLKGQDSANLGDDSSGNTNDFTSSGLTSADQMPDTPTANLPTFNPLSKGSGTLSDGNLQYVGVGSWTNVRLNLLLPETGKWAVRFKTTTSYQQIMVGACAPDSATTYGDLDVNGVAQLRYNTQDGNFVTRVGGSRIEDTGPPTVAAQTWFQLLFDMDTGQMGMAADGATSGTFADISTYPIMDLHGASLSTARQIYALVYSGTDSGAGAIFDAGQSGWTPAVTGFSALTLANLPNPTIALPSENFTTLLYAGSSSVQSVTGVGFSPDILWIKNRDAAQAHTLFDKVRGAGATVYPPLTNGEDVNTTKMQSFDSDGFTLGGGYAEVNTAGNNFVSWNWYTGGGTGSSNTDGDVTSTVSVNTTAGFSVVTYTPGTGVHTWGHGLGVAPSMVIVKDRGEATNWLVYHASLGPTQKLILNLTNATATDSGIWNNTAPTSSVVTTGSGLNDAHGFVAYCFAEVEGFSKFGKYTGNGSADGPFIYTGFRPAFILYKNTTTAGTNWDILDNTRETYNTVGQQLFANLTNAEAAEDHRWDFLSNGFKARDGSSSNNGSGATIVYAAFAETPFKYANAR